MNYINVNTSYIDLTLEASAFIFSTVKKSQDYETRVLKNQKDNLR